MSQAYLLATSQSLLPQGCGSDVSGPWEAGCNLSLPYSATSVKPTVGFGSALFLAYGMQPNLDGFPGRVNSVLEFELKQPNSFLASQWDRSVTASSPLFEGLLVLLGHVRKSSWTCVHSSKQWFWANWPPRSLLALEVYSLKFMKYSINCPLGFISILALLWNRDFQNMYPCFFLELLLFQFPHTDLWSSILN